MRTFGKFFVIVTLALTSSCVTNLPYPPPIIEDCFGNKKADGLVCFDERKSEEEQEYDRALKFKDRCTNSPDEIAVEKYILFLRQEIQKLRIRLGE